MKSRANLQRAKLQKQAWWVGCVLALLVALGQGFGGLLARVVAHHGG